LKAKAEPAFTNTGSLSNQRVKIWQKPGPLIFTDPDAAGSSHRFYRCQIFD
jgi:hypothetical protein